MFRQAPGSAPILRLFSSRPPSSNLSTAPRLRNSSSEWLKEEEVAIARSPGGSPHRETHTRSSSCALCTPVGDARRSDRDVRLGDSDCDFACERRRLFPGAQKPRAGRGYEQPGGPHRRRKSARPAGGAKRKG